MFSNVNERYVNKHIHGKTNRPIVTISFGLAEIQVFKNPIHDILREI